jgi:hypothetical protein
MESFPSSYDTLNLYVESVLYPVSDKHSICIFKLKLKKWMFYIDDFFDTPQQLPCSSSTWRTYCPPYVFYCLSPFLPATHHVLSPRDFNACRFPRGRLVRCSPHSFVQLQLESFLTQLQLESFPRLPLLFLRWWVVLPSSKSIRRGDTVAKKVKEINKTKKKIRREKTTQKSAQLMNPTTLLPSPDEPPPPFTRLPARRRTRLRRSLPLPPLSVPVDSAAAVVPGALRWGRRRTWGCGLWVVEQGRARRRRRGGVYFPFILPLPHSLLLLSS